MMKGRMITTTMMEKRMTSDGRTAHVAALRGDQAGKSASFRMPAGFFKTTMTMNASRSTTSFNESPVGEHRGCVQRLAQVLTLPSENYSTSANLPTVLT